MPEFARTLIDVVRHTPAWVWLLYAFLLFLAARRLRASIVSPARLLALPLGVLVLAVPGWITASAGLVPWLLPALALGAAGGWSLGRNDGSARLDDGRIFVPGESLTLMQMMAVLVLRYAMQVAPFVAPQASASPVWQVGTLAASAALTAGFLGRTAARLSVAAADAPGPG